MNRLPEQSSATPRYSRSVRVVHFSIRPRTWVGRIVLAVGGAIAVAFAFFLSIIAMFVAAGLLGLGLLYLALTLRRMRRAQRGNVIEAEVSRREVQ
jgi:uncharacterized membrane protein